MKQFVRKRHTKKETRRVKNRQGGQKRAKPWEKKTQLKPKGETGVETCRLDKRTKKNVREDNQGSRNNHGGGAVIAETDEKSLGRGKRALYALSVQTQQTKFQMSGGSSLRNVVKTKKKKEVSGLERGKGAYLKERQVLRARDSLL